MVNNTYADRFSVSMASATLDIALRLHDEFDGVFSLETVERYLHSSFADLEARASVSRFVPLIAERTARDQLRAVASEGLSPGRERPVVLFVASHDVARSQMAVGILDRIAGGRARALSGGACPGTQLDSDALEAMREIGLPVSTDVPAAWTDETVAAADVVVTMAYGDACPVIHGKRYEDWVFDAPRTGSLEQARAIRDDIAGRVRHLAHELGLAA